MKNIIIGVSIFVVVIGLMVVGYKKNTGNNNQANLGSAVISGQLKVVDGHTSFDFGTISMAKKEVSHSFIVKNESANPAIVKKMYTSCMCTSANLVNKNGTIGPFGMAGHGFIPTINQRIEPGEEANIEVIFDPNAHGPAGVGPIDRVVYIEQQNGDTLELNVKGVVTP